MHMDDLTVDGMLQRAQVKDDCDFKKALLYCTRHTCIHFPFAAGQIKKRERERRREGSDRWASE